MKIRFSIKNILIAFLAFLIMVSHTIYTYMNFNIFNTLLKVLISFMPILIMFFTKYKIHNRIALRLGNIMLLYFFMTILFFIVDVRGNSIGSYVFRFFIYLPSMIILFCYVDYEEILYSFENVMVFIGLIEFISWILFTVFNLETPTGQMFSTWGNSYVSHYFGIYFEIPANTLNIPFYRNTGIFAEAPAFCFNLCIALLVELYIAKKKSIKKTIILILAILSTISTTGFVLLFFTFITKIWEFMKEKRHFVFIKWILILFVLLIGSFILYLLATGKGKAGSLLLRGEDYINAINAFFLSPIFGYGYQLDTKIFNAGYSNSLSVVLTNGGILLLAIYMIPMLEGVVTSLKQNKDHMYWWVGVIMLFSVCAVTYTYLLLSIIAIGYSNIIKRITMNS